MAANPYAVTENTYTAADAGCWFDGSRGIHLIDAVVNMAVEAHKMPYPKCECDHGAYTFSECEFMGEIEDECDEFMNEHFSVDGHYWGRSEQGDWGLWECDES